MKLLLCFVVAAVVVASQAETPQEKLRKYSDECVSESGISQETLTKVRNDEEVDDPKLKEHAFCILKKSGFIDDEGHLQKETILTKFKEHSDNVEGVEKLVNKCAVQKETPQETSAHFIKCVHEARQKHHH